MSRELSWDDWKMPQSKSESEIRFADEYENRRKHHYDTSRYYERSVSGMDSLLSVPNSPPRVRSVRSIDEDEYQHMKRELSHNHNVIQDYSHTIDALNNELKVLKKPLFRTPKNLIKKFKKLSNKNKLLIKQTNTNGNT